MPRTRQHGPKGLRGSRKGISAKGTGGRAGSAKRGTPGRAGAPPPVTPHPPLTLEGAAITLERAATWSGVHDAARRRLRCSARAGEPLTPHDVARIRHALRASSKRCWRSAGARVVANAVGWGRAGTRPFPVPSASAARCPACLASTVHVIGRQVGVLAIRSAWKASVKRGAW